MGGSAATFGYVHVRAEGAWGADVGVRFFMSIGSAIRTEGPPGSMDAFARARAAPVLMAVKKRGEGR